LWLAPIVIERSQAIAYTLEDELVEVEPARRFLSRVTGDALEATVETTLVPTGSGTAVMVRWTGEPKPLLLKLLFTLRRAAIIAQVAANLARLKQVVENE
jgi:hypothetical protein